MNFAAALRATIEQEGVRREEIAVAAGASVSAVTKWLAGDGEPSVTRYTRLRKAYPSLAALMDRAA